MPQWRSPEELAEIGLTRSRVLMVNEAHDGLRRCIRTREIGMRLIEPAHAAGVRHLAMEALTPDFAAAANHTRSLGPGSEYLAQPDLRSLIAAALEHGWSLIAYEADVGDGDHGLLSARNDREEQQARNLAAACGRLPRGGKLMVWCGWSHHFKRPLRLPDGKLEFMGSRFRRAARVTPFCIDQCQTVRWNVRRNWESRFVARRREVLERFGGTAGHLVGFPRGPLSWIQRSMCGIDAVIYSLHNDLE